MRTLRIVLRMIVTLHSSTFLLLGETSPNFTVSGYGCDIATIRLGFKIFRPREQVALDFNIYNVQTY